MQGSEVLVPTISVFGFALFGLWCWWCWSVAMRRRSAVHPRNDANSIPPHVQLAWRAIVWALLFGVLLYLANGLLHPHAFAFQWTPGHNVIDTRLLDEYGRGLSVIPPVSLAAGLALACVVAIVEAIGGTARHAEPAGQAEQGTK